MRIILVLTVVSYCCGQGFVPDGYETVTSGETKDNFGAYDRCGEGSSAGKKICVPYHRCDGATKTVVVENANTDGHGLIDIRMKEDECPHFLDVCCNLPSGGTVTSGPDISPSPSEPDLDPTPNPVPFSPPPPVTPQSPPPIPSPRFCGMRNNNGIDFKITGNLDREAEFGEFPWMVSILKNSYDSKPAAICGGSLIAPQVVLTGAHCVYMYKTGDLTIRAGEWDTQTEKERLPYQDRRVDKIIIHEKFNPRNLFNDIALILLANPVQNAEHIGTVCLPEPEETFDDSGNCFAMGWGKDAFNETGRYQSILKKIELPIVSRVNCEQALQKSRLGKHFVLDESFVCAGGEPGKDACTGDGGGPLVCPNPNHPARHVAPQYLQVGVVAWGIGCGDFPGVYADVTKFRLWIDENMQRLGLDNKPYTI